MIKIFFSLSWIVTKLPQLIFSHSVWTLLKSKQLVFFFLFLQCTFCMIQGSTVWVYHCVSIKQLHLETKHCAERHYTAAFNYCISGFCHYELQFSHYNTWPIVQLKIFNIATWKYSLHSSFKEVIYIRIFSI